MCEWNEENFTSKFEYPFSADSEDTGKQWEQEERVNN